MKIIDIYNAVIKQTDDIVMSKVQEFCIKTRTDIKDLILLEQRESYSVIYYIIRKDIHDGLETDKEVLEHAIPLCKINYEFE